MDDSAAIAFSPRDKPDDASLDLWLKTWFQLMVAEPVPPTIMELIEQLETGCGLRAR